MGRRPSIRPVQRGAAVAAHGRAATNPGALKAEREATASSLSKAARKHRRNKDAPVRDGVRTVDEQLLQARYCDVTRAYGEATTRYKATVEKLTAEKEAARAEAAATQKSRTMRKSASSAWTPRTEVALPCKHFASAPSAPLGSSGNARFATAR